MMNLFDGEMFEDNPRVFPRLIARRNFQRTISAISGAQENVETALKTLKNEFNDHNMSKHQSTRSKIDEVEISTLSKADSAETRAMVRNSIQLQNKLIQSSDRQYYNTKSLIRQTGDSSEKRFEEAQVRLENSTSQQHKATRAMISEGQEDLRNILTEKQKELMSNNSNQHSKTLSMVTKAEEKVINVIDQNYSKLKAQTDTAFNNTQQLITSLSQQNIKLHTDANELVKSLEASLIKGMLEQQNHHNKTQALLISSYDLMLQNSKADQIELSKFVLERAEEIVKEIQRQNDKLRDDIKHLEEKRNRLEIERRENFKKLFIIACFVAFIGYVMFKNNLKLF